MAFRGHNLGPVVGFEFMRTIRKKGFVIATLAVPVLLVAIFAMMIRPAAESSAGRDHHERPRAAHPG